MFSETRRVREDCGRSATLLLPRAAGRILRKQAEYFAGLSGESDAGAWVKHARALYQQGRSAYDAQQSRRARKLAEAAALVVSALQLLAQARASSQEPPRLP